LVTAVAAVAVKFADTAPAGIWIEGGTVRLELLLDRLTTAPPEGAAPVNPIVQAAVPGGVNAIGVQVKLLNSAFRISSENAREIAL
jgi:hypothetical protein